ncbi:hypothetical protein [Levilactobacillus senmaizukei]|uniref:hypothetical protein n=1 Tax=Levilactobacillus senmaizukei TaxID=431273 RepID=UPI00077BF13E|nr:hypothetical protein [Levilactobacillus senmaizukei]
MAHSRQLEQPNVRLHVAKTRRRQALMPLRSAASHKLALIVGYRAMALINQDLTRMFTPCEEEAERRLTQFRRK